MSDTFIVPPRPKRRIPMITLSELIEAIGAYLTAYTDFGFEFGDFEGERFDGYSTTRVFFYGRFDPEKGRRLCTETTIEGKRCQSLSAKLFNDPSPFMFLGDVDLKPGLIVEPLEDRSIAIHRIKRWDKGSAYY
ncbi:hypothetical protein [Jiella pacifica]|uniref:Uncharacterized protein n=1 Tax=Jiella pacifica TaxID=2696469 RepID=A0A6N9T7Z9_9HYPH|nr:hypothetical protein [Jiella pacifica]NDW06186.1 hypothetical protein [Jiella pacifica]